MIRLRRVVFYLCAVATVWAAVVALTGGLRVRLGSVRVSSRDPWNAVVIALLSALAVRVLSSLLGGRSALREEWSWWKRVGLVGKRLGRAGVASWRRQWRRCQQVSPSMMVALVGVGLYIYQWVAAPPLWLDEETIALNVRDRSFEELAGSLWFGQSAPLGWLIVERAAALALGAGEIALRLVPVLFGIATVAAALWIGRRWMGAVGAVVLVLLCSFGQWLAHYPFEVKHYTADACYALLLPALAVWATEADSSTDRIRRAAAWWVAAAAGQWLANGALLVTPACALFLVGAGWRRDGRKAAVMVALFGCIWLASFGLHYQLSVRYSVNSEYLQSYWAAQVPPASVGLIGTARWVLDRFEPLASNPAGTGLWMSLWLSAACGLVFGSRSALGLVFATVPLSAFALSALRLVPLYERLSLWIVPSLYVGIALVVDRVARLGRDAYRGRRWTLLAVATVVAFAELQLCADIFRRGKADLALAPKRESKHRLDDRAAGRWLMRQRHPGDALMTTRLAWPAIWWYGEIPIWDEDTAHGRLPDGGVMYEMAHVSGESDCRQDQLGDALKDHRRVLVYLGFRDVPTGFDDLLLHSLAQLGTIAAFKEFSELSRAAVIDLHVAGPGETTVRQLIRRAAGQPGRLDGCVGVRPALRW